VSNLTVFILLINNFLSILTLAKLD